MSDRWMELEAIPASMAAAVRPALAAVDQGGYQRFLEAMVHYTRHSGMRLHHAAEHAPDDALRAFFAQLAREESGHFKLAEADLAGLGLECGEVEPDVVARFHRRWMETLDAAWWLGALYALESVGEHLQSDAVTNLGRLGLGRDQARFVMVHLEADVEHGATAAHFARRALDESPERVLDAARSAGEFWVALHLDAMRLSEP